MGKRDSYCYDTQKLGICGITSITSNGLDFIALDAKMGKIILLDENFEVLKSISSKCKYSSICFDQVNDCYWAIESHNASIIYQLDFCFNEISQICIRNIMQYEATGISYNDCKEVICISFDNFIGYVKVGEDTMNCIENRRRTMLNKSILSLPNCTLVSYDEECIQFIEINLKDSYRDLMECAPEGYSIKDMCLNSCIENKHEGSSTYGICLLLCENCSGENYIMKFSLKFYNDKSIEVIYASKENKELEDYMDNCKADNIDNCTEENNIDYNDEYQSDYGEECKHDYNEDCKLEYNEGCKPEYSECKYDYNERTVENYRDKYPNKYSENHTDGCDNHHHNCKCNGEYEESRKCCSCGKSCLSNASYEIMRSIALEEAAIAHILNAEGEKIQKAVATVKDIDKLLCINESVKQTIIHITQLETQLYLKLESIQKNSYCDNCCKNNYTEECEEENPCAWREYPYEVDDCDRDDYCPN